MHAAARIEALRLLARCRGARGDKHGAVAALESGVGEARACGYVWMHACCLRDMLGWVEDAGEVKARIDAVEAGFGK